MQAPKRRYTVQEYWQIEQNSDQRHEYHDFEVYAMAGGTARHAALQRNVIVALHAQLRHTGRCSVYPSDMRISVPDFHSYYYPDAFVVCGELSYDANVPHSIINPVLIVEVLSASSERFDRGKKFSRYRTLPSLTDYLLISQDEMLVEHYQRQGDKWLLTPLTQAQALVTLSTLGINLSLQELYEGIDLESGESLGDGQ